MKKTDCKYYEPIVESYARQSGEINGEAIAYLDYDLVDEVCTVDKDNPKHHNEYECEGCKYYERN